MSGLELELGPTHYLLYYGYFNKAAFAVLNYRRSALLLRLRAKVIIVKLNVINYWLKLTIGTSIRGILIFKFQNRSLGIHQLQSD